MEPHEPVACRATPVDRLDPVPCALLAAQGVQAACSAHSRAGLDQAMPEPLLRAVQQDHMQHVLQASPMLQAEPVVPDPAHEPTAPHAAPTLGLVLPAAFGLDLVLQSPWPREPTWGMGCMQRPIGHPCAMALVYTYGLQPNLDQFSEPML